MVKNSKKRAFYRDKQLKKAIIYLSPFSKNKNYLSKNLLSLIFILLFFPIILSNKIFQKLRNLDNDSEIKIRVKGKGDMNILFNSFTPLPSVIYVDNVENPPSKSIYKSNEGEYEVIMKFGTAITSCEKMFSGCNYITEVDLSNFDTSNINNMENMFYGCTNLESINFGNFDTSSVTSMGHLFHNCKILKSLDLSKFHTSKTENMCMMFYNCNSLKFLDVSSFDTSSVTTMNSMFYKCSQLTSLNLLKFDTSSVSTMYDMFYGCSELSYLNLSKFDTSKVTSMKGMFRECKQLEELNLENFITSSVTQMNEMFKDCISLKTLNIPNFNTQTVTNMQYMFSGCKNLLSLDLSNFNTESVTQMDNMFSYCELLIYLNLISFTVGSETNINNMLNGITSTKFCVKDDKLKEELLTLNINNICEEDSCFTIIHAKIFPEEFKCIEKCNDDSEYVLEYNNICYKHCPDCTSKSSINENLCEKVCNEECIYKYGALCIQETNTGQETDKPTEPETDKPTEHETDKPTDHETDKQTEPETDKQTEPETDKPTEHETDKPTEHETDKPTEPETDNPTETKIDNPTESETNNVKTSEIESDSEKEITVPKINETELIMNCGAEDLFIGKSCGTEISSPTNKDQLINNIQNDIMNRKIDSLLDNITKTKEDLVVQEKDTIYQITTTENQNSNEYKNMSTVNLGVCEDRLKDIYKIDKNLPLIIFKIDYYSPDLLIPVIGYEIFHPVNKSKLDLNYCKDILIELNIPVSIDEDNLFKHDPNSGYYQDECVPSTSENGTDIILNDRQNEYNNNNLSLCQNNCTFTGYDPDSKKALCDCEVKTKINLISEIIDDKNILSSNFTSNEGSTSNIVTMKCVYTLFSKDGLKSNIGSYILLLVITIFIVSSILFYKVGYPLLENDIKLILLEKGKSLEKNNDMNIYKYEQKGGTMKYNKIKRKKGKKIKNKKRKRKKPTNIFDAKYPPKKNVSEKLKKLNSTKQNESIQQSKLKLKDVQVLINLEKRESNKRKSPKLKSNRINPEKPNEIDFTKYNDNELNSMTYKEALLYDKRPFSQYYIYLLKTKQLILFAFCPKKDYNTMIVKVNIFFLSFSVFYAVNAIFFNESTIHKIYQDGGSYDLVYLLPKILYSFIISQIFCTVIRIAFLSEKNIMEVKREKDINSSKDKADKVKRCIVIKYIVFYVAGILFLMLFWYYLSSFGAVYQNTQIFLIKNTLFSFLISLIYPFIINIFPSIFRIASLRTSNSDKEVLFKTSRILQYI